MNLVDSIKFCNVYTGGSKDDKNSDTQLQAHCCGSAAIVAHFILRYPPKGTIEIGPPKNKTDCYKTNVSV